MRRIYLPAALVLVALPFAQAQDDRVARDFDRLQANFLMTYGERNGEAFSEDVIKKCSCLWKGNSLLMILPQDSNEPIAGRVTLDPSKRPAQINWVGTNGPDNGKRMFGIYEFIDDTQYRVCFDPAGKVRPKNFATTPGSGFLLHVWRRAPG